MRMHGCLRRSVQVALSRLKVDASAVNEDVMAGRSNPFLQGAAGNAAGLR
jgi:hypothetical protein